MEPNPVQKHRADAAATIASGDPRAIKQLYVDLGDDLWQRHADDPDQLPLFSLAGTHQVVANAFEGSEGTFLDAGCGPNPALSVTLARPPGRRVVALDISEGTVRGAVAVGRRRGVELTGVVADVEQLPFRSGAIDAVACDDTIEHLPNDVAGVSELFRVARPGALVVIATPNRWSLGVIRRRAFDLMRGQRHAPSHYFVSKSHLREYTTGECSQLISPIARIEARRGVPFMGHGISPTLTRVVNWFVTRPPMRRLGPMIVLVARTSRGGRS